MMQNPAVVVIITSCPVPVNGARANMSKIIESCPTLCYNAFVSNGFCDMILCLQKFVSSSFDI